jgi:hypothetical protein
MMLVRSVAWSVRGYDYGILGTCVREARQEVFEGCMAQHGWVVRRQEWWELALQRNC